MITRPRIKYPSSVFTDISVVAVMVILLYGIMQVARRWEAPLESIVSIDLSLWSLPRYTLLSFLRGFVAYGLSLLFALSYGYAGWSSKHL